MIKPLVVGFVLLLSITLIATWLKQRTLRRETFIRNFTLPKGLFERLKKRHPALGPKECQLVAQGLRQFFLAYLKSGRRFVAMPSQVADDLWHEFILYTQNYDYFCKQAFGQFFHHTPAAILGGAKQSNEGLRRCWWHACREENINPRSATRLPLLFALDSKLGIAGGFSYVPDCTGIRHANDTSGGSGTVHCGSDFSSSSIDGSTDGFGDSSASGDSGSGDSGDSGGCGGGCGGGGD